MCWTRVHSCSHGFPSFHSQVVARWGPHCHFFMPAFPKMSIPCAFPWDFQFLPPFLQTLCPSSLTPCSPDTQKVKSICSHKIVIHKPRSVPLVLSFAFPEGVTRGWKLNYFNGEKSTANFDHPTSLFCNWFPTVSPSPACLLLHPPWWGKMLVSKQFWL